MTLSNCKKIEIRSSSLEGLGIFATDDIEKNTILEEVPFIVLPRYTNLSKGLFDFLIQTNWAHDKEAFADNIRLNLKFKDPEKYYFKWYPKHPLKGEPIMFTVLPLGFGCIYNSSNTDNNAGWEIKEETFIFRAVKDIKKDEEIKTFYGYFLGEGGQIFNCDTVFNMALDEKGILRAFRFGDLASFEAGRNNPSYIKGQQLIANAIDGLRLLKISYLQNNTESGVFEFNQAQPLSIIYNKLSEYKANPLPFIRLDIEFENKSDNKIIKDFIIFKNH